MTIAIVGSGNVASWLLNELIIKKFSIAGIYSRNKITSRSLAKKYKVSLFENIETVQSDIIFICVNDDSIKVVANQLKNKTGIIVHTSGTVSMNAMNRQEKCGVLYPLQTLTPSKKDKVEIPIFITSSDKKTEEAITKIAKSISNKIYFITDEQRKQLHLAAVITNNFINHLVVESKDFLEKNNLQYEMIIPLLKHTFEKLTSKPYNFTQTGPAKRGDNKTIAEHKKILKQNDQQLLKIYEAITKSIITKYQ